MADERIKDLATQARTAAADDFVERDGATNGSRKIWPGDADGQFGNAKARLAAAYFDGTSSSGITRDGGAVLAFGASVPLCFSFFADVPASNPSGTLQFCGLSDTARNHQRAGAAFMYLDTSRNLKCRLYGATTSDYRELTVSLTGYGGVMVHIYWDVRAALVYINGVAITTSAATAGTPPAWSAAVTGTIYNVGCGGSSNNEVFIGRMAAFAIWNLQLTAAEVLQLFQDAGVPQYKHWWASQVDPFTGNFGGINAPDSLTGTSPTGYTAVKTTSAGAVRVGKSGLTLQNPRYTVRVTFDAVLNSGAAPVLNTLDSGGGSRQNLITLATGFNSVNWVFGNYSPGAYLTFTVESGQVSDWSVSNFLLVQLGAIVFLPLDDGIGYQAHDQSSNKLDGTITTTGVSHVVPKRTGYVRGTLTWSATHEGKSLLSQRALPVGAAPTLLTLTPTASTSGSGATVGTTNTATRWAALAALTANTRKVMTLANQVPAGTAANDHDVVIDPDTSNYTGSITAEMHYAVTEGTP